jgi:hypothetical protein
MPIVPAYDNFTAIDLLRPDRPPLPRRRRDRAENRGAQAPISPAERREAQLAWRTTAKPRCAVSVVRNGTCMKCDTCGVTIF